MKKTKDACWHPVERVVKRAFIGRRVSIRDGAFIGQDHQFGTWKDESEVFIITGIGSATRFKLTAPGYGQVGNYGNGAIYAYKQDLRSV